jgi:hypothetical protein
MNIFKTKARVLPANYRGRKYLPSISLGGVLRTNDRWTVPIGDGVGIIVRFGKLLVSICTQFFRNVARPDGVAHWSARFQAQLLFRQYEGEKK